MVGWTRIWLVVSILVSAGWTAYQAIEMGIDIPIKRSVYPKVATQFDYENCKQFRFLTSTQRSNHFHVMSEHMDCAGVIDFTFKNPFDEWVKSSEDYERWVEGGNRHRDRKIQGLTIGLPITFLISFSGSWLVFLVVRPTCRWIAAGFRRNAQATKC